VNFGDWARKRLRPIVDKLFRAVPILKTDVAAMHQFRIRGKKLRYAMELLPGAFPDEFRTRLYATIESMQDRLGEINDLAMTRIRLQKKLDLLGEEDAAAWHAVMEREQTRFLDATQRFWNWCTPEKLEELWQCFERLLSDHHQGGHLTIYHLVSSTAE
jgi:CHAD domain-containing protein